jgi:DNA-binding transcriptional LysR family regulator
MPGHFETRAYFSENRVLAVHRNHPQFDSLMTDPQKTLAETTLLTSYLDEATKRPGEGRLRSRFAAVWEISNLDLRLALAAAGKGVTYLSDRLLQDAEGMVAIPGLAAASIPRQVGIYYKKHEPLSTGAKRFRALCDRHFGSTPADG